MQQQASFMIHRAFPAAAAFTRCKYVPLRYAAEVGRVAPTRSVLTPPRLAGVADAGRSFREYQFVMCAKSARSLAVDGSGTRTASGAGAAFAVVRLLEIAEAGFMDEGRGFDARVAVDG